jgi:DNA-binding transcriptional regulator YhcF (GntR family)
MEFNGNKAIYIQIAEMICEKILLAIFLPDHRIPSVRELAIDIEVNPNTVMRTYEFLQELGIITNKRGVGFFVTTDGIEMAKNYRRTEFIERELPDLAKTINLLNIDMTELVKLFQNQQQKKK